MWIKRWKSRDREIIRIRYLSCCENSVSIEFVNNFCFHKCDLRGFQVLFNFSACISLGKIPFLKLKHMKAILTDSRRQKIETIKLKIINDMCVIIIWEIGRFAGKKCWLMIFINFEALRVDVHGCNDRQALLIKTTYKRQPIFIENYFLFLFYDSSRRIIAKICLRTEKIFHITWKQYLTLYFLVWKIHNFKFDNFCDFSHTSSLVFHYFSSQKNRANKYLKIKVWDRANTKHTLA